MKALLFVITALLTACSSPQICTRPITSSEPKAQRILQQCQQAHGAKAFSKLKDVSVSYAGKWGAIGPRFQPILVDKQYRQASEERLLLKQGIIAQQHTGPSGTKTVVRTPTQVTVKYAGKPSNDTETQYAAALVANAYQLFLLGPHYLKRKGVTLAYEGTQQVESTSCHVLLAQLKPGFGFAQQDHVKLFINTKDLRLLRLRMTLNGVESTQGAEVDVTFKDYLNIGGILWPTDFDERIRTPFDLHAHHWKLTGLDVNRGIQLKDLNAWNVKASRPSKPLP